MAAEALNIADDHYERYYTEKIWALVPEVYKDEDGRQFPPGVLRAIVEVIAAQAAVTRRSIDRLWEDQHVETADDWAVPYIGDLVGTRPLPEIDARARRVDVARTIFFRRRRGTPVLLETLVRELSSWDVVLVEAFRRLARTFHRLDEVPIRTGRFTRTPQAGTADLRNPRASELQPGPFDEFFHTVDVRRHRGLDGWFNIRKLNFHLFRLRSFPIQGAIPYPLKDTELVMYTFDPSGRDVPLFTKGEPIEHEDAHGPIVTLDPNRRPFPFSLVDPRNLKPRRCGSPDEWEVAQPIPCRLLGHAEYQVEVEYITQLAVTGPDEIALLTIVGQRFRGEARLRQALEGYGVDFTTPPVWYRELLRLTLTSDSGKKNLYRNEGDPKSIAISIEEPGEGDADYGEIQYVQAADLSDLDCLPEPSDVGVLTLIDAERGRFAWLTETPPTGNPIAELYHYGFAGGVGAWPNHDRKPPTPMHSFFKGLITLCTPNDVVRLTSSRNFSLALDHDVEIGDVEIYADPEHRPYLLVSGDDEAEVTGAANLRPAAPQTDETRKFVLDGIWVGSADDVHGDFVIEAATPGEAHDTFDWDEIVMRETTLDPGGVRADGSSIIPLRIRVLGRIRRLVIERSITGPIHVEQVEEDCGKSGFVEELEIRDSIIDGTLFSESDFTIDCATGRVVLRGVTVLGSVRATLLDASDSIVTGTLHVRNQHASCFRFSATSPGGTLPRVFEASTLIEIAPAFFTSLRFGDPGYCQLSVAAPDEIKRGAENRSEMGAFSFLLRPIQFDSILAKVNEFKPAGVIDQYIFEGEQATGTWPLLPEQ